MNRPRPKFQRRHHDAIASIMQDADDWAEIVEELVLLFQNDNPGFDLKRFCEGCGQLRLPLK